MAEADAEETVVARVLESLTILAERRLLTRAKIWDLVAQIAGFLCHPNIWIREGSFLIPLIRIRLILGTVGAAAFLSTVSNMLPPTDRWCSLYPTIKRSLRADIKEITAFTLLDNAREPVSPSFCLPATLTDSPVDSSSHLRSCCRLGKSE